MSSKRAPEVKLPELVKFGKYQLTLMANALKMGIEQRKLSKEASCPAIHDIM